MPLFPVAALRRATPSAAAGERGDLSDRLRLALPLRFEAVAEALAAGDDVTASCSVVGRDVARDGTALAEALAGLRTTYAMVLGAEPAFDASEALSVAWSDATLEYLHDLSCEDPLTGLASLAHVRTRLAEVYREAELTDVPVLLSHALVVVELRPQATAADPGHQFTRAMRLVQVTESMRAVFCGGQTLGRLAQDRAVAMVQRTSDLGMSVSLLRDVLADLDLDRAEVRVWIEGLPGTADSARRLVDDLAR